MAVEEKVIAAVKEKKTTNEKEYTDHVTSCQKIKAKANVSTAAVNDAATTLKNQREYQVQITNLKDVLIKSHEQALTKRAEAEKIFSNYTTMVTKYEEQLTITQEQILESKTKMGAAQEVQRIMSVRMKEITTLLARPTITVAEKAKLTKEEEEAKGKFETQQNVMDAETKATVTLETSVTAITGTIKTFKKYIEEVKVVVKELEKKVSETKTALKPAPAPKPKADDAAPPVKGKDTEKEDATKTDKDEDGDDKVDDIDEKVDDEGSDAVKGGNEKVDKELDQVEEENKSTTTQIDSLTKTIVSVQEKSEISDKETVQETTDNTKEDAEVAEIEAKKTRLIRLREHQRCARLFPAVFSSFKIKKELTAENMCPCPGGGKGLTQLILDGIEDPGDYDKFVLHLFEKNLALEGIFQTQMQRYFFGEDDKLVSEEKNPVSLRLVMADDKVDEVMNALDAQNAALKS